MACTANSQSPVRQDGRCHVADEFMPSPVEFMPSPVWANQSPNGGAVVSVGGGNCNMSQLQLASGQVTPIVPIAREAWVRDQRKGSQ